MNYIKHLNHWFEELRMNSDAKPTHISLYFALFQMWNINRFPEKFVINRYELMTLSKIGSKTTYSNLMQDLHRWGWVHYVPSQSKYGISAVKLLNMTDKPPASCTTFETSTEASSATSYAASNATSSGRGSGQVLGHNSKTINKELTKNKINKKYYEQM